MDTTHETAPQGAKETPARAGRKVATPPTAKGVDPPVFPHLVLEPSMVRTMETEDTIRELPLLRVVKVWAKAMVERVRVSKEDAIVAENLDTAPMSAT